MVIPGGGESDLEKFKDRMETEGEKKRKEKNKKKQKNTTTTTTKKTQDRSIKRVGRAILRYETKWELKLSVIIFV